MKMNIEELKAHIEKSMNGVDIVAQQLDELVNIVVDKACSELDNYVAYVKALLDADKLLMQLIYSKVIDAATCGDIKKIIEQSTVVEKAVL